MSKFVIKMLDKGAGTGVSSNSPTRGSQVARHAPAIGSRVPNSNGRMIYSATSGLMYKRGEGNVWTAVNEEDYEL